MKYQLQSGMPIPPRIKEKKYPFLDTMRIGDCVQVESWEDAIKIRDVMRKRGMNPVYRKIPNVGWRVWYVGDKDET